MRLTLLTAILPLASALPPGLTRKHTPRDGTAQVVILADTNRDGKVDINGTSDRGPGKDAWTDESGALFLPNIGDTADRCRKLHRSDSDLVNCNDASDDVQRAPKYLAPLYTIPIEGLSASAVGRISVSDPIARQSIRIFRPGASADDWTIVNNDTSFSAAELAKGLQLGIDARGPRGHLVTGLDADGDSKTDTPQTWDGRVTVQFSVTDGQTSLADSVMLRVAPLVTYNHLQPVIKVFSFQHTNKKPYYNTVFNGIAAGVKKAGINEPIQEVRTLADDFIQDLFEAMYASIPGPDGSVIGLPVILPVPRNDPFLVGPELVAREIRSTGIGMVTDVPSGDINQETLDSMGNLETIPPYEHNGKKFPAGRVVLGANQTAGRVPVSLPFLQAQEMQDPILVDSTWLEVQHVDEFLQFLPANTPRKWSVMVSDPLAAVKILEEAKAAGHGDKLFTSHPEFELYESTSVNGYLNDNIKATNEECARHIQGTIDMLKRETGITDDEIFRTEALYPSAVNGLVLTDSFYLAPKQWGLPDMAGDDTMERAVEEAYKKAGFTVEFTDDWDFHLRKGDVHCLTNVLRQIPGTDAVAAVGAAPASGGGRTPWDREKEICESLAIDADQCRPRVSQCIFEAGSVLKKQQEDATWEIIRQCVSETI